MKIQHLFCMCLILGLSFFCREAFSEVVAECAEEVTIESSTLSSNVPRPWRASEQEALDVCGEVLDEWIVQTTHFFKKEHYELHTDCASLDPSQRAGYRLRHSPAAQNYSTSRDFSRICSNVCGRPQHNRIYRITGILYGHHTVTAADCVGAERKCGGAVTSCRECAPEEYERNGICSGPKSLPTFFIQETGKEKRGKRIFFDGN